MTFVDNIYKLLVNYWFGVCGWFTYLSFVLRYNWRVKNSGALHRTFNVEPLYLQHENSGKKMNRNNLINRWDQNALKGIVCYSLCKTKQKKFIGGMDYSNRYSHRYKFGSMSSWDRECNSKLLESLVLLSSFVLYVQYILTRYDSQTEGVKSEQRELNKT